MAVTIDESLLLGMAGVVFLPVFVFLIKMIMKVGTLENKLDNIHSFITSTEKSSVELINAKTEIKLLEARVKGLEKDVDYLLALDRGRSGQNISGQNRSISYNTEHDMDRKNQKDER